MLVTEEVVETFLLFRFVFSPFMHFLRVQVKNPKNYAFADDQIYSVVHLDLDRYPRSTA